MAKEKTYKCPGCGGTVTPSLTGDVVAPNRRHWHPNCYEAYLKKPKKKTVSVSSDDPIKKLSIPPEAENLFFYCKRVYGLDFNAPIFTRQLKALQSEGFSIPEISATIKWFYEIERKSPQEVKTPLGMIPYAYKEAMDYYREIQKAVSANEGKVLTESPPQEVVIQSPTREQKRSRRFKFLEEEVIDG